MQHLEIISREALLISGCRALCVHERGPDVARPVAARGRQRPARPCVDKLRNNIAPIIEVFSAHAANFSQPFSFSIACLEIGTS